MPSPVRSEKVTTRVREREREILESAAERRGVHLSELVREAALDEARREILRDGPPETSDA